jgi:hypothetical protein
MILRIIFNAFEDLRRSYLIHLQIAMPDSIIRSVHDEDYVGEVGITLDEFKEWAESKPEVFRNIIAASVRWRKKDEEVQVELDSWAYRPNGRFSDIQYHLVPIGKKDSIELFCHKEYNPIKHPLKHRKKEILGEEGVEFAEKLKIM